MSLLRYAASGVVRNRRRTFSSILGVLLAITFIAGTFIAIDSSTRATLDATLNAAGGDYTYSAYPPSSASPSSSQGNGSDLRVAFAAVSGVEDVSVYQQVTSFMGPTYVANAADPANLSTPMGRMEGIDPYHLPYQFRQATISGSILLPNGSAAVDTQTASMIHAKVGDPILLEYQEWNGSGPTTIPINHTLTFTLGATVDLTSSSSPYYPGPIYGPYPGYYGSVFAVNLRDLPGILTSLNLTRYNSVVLQGEIWIDRNRFVDPYDLTSTTFQLTRLDRSLSEALVAAGYNGNVNDNLSYALQSFSNLILVERIEFLLLSFPVILLGLYLGAVGVDLGHAERRRELGVLKTRGASRRQVALLLVLESLLGGFLATVLGLIFGLGLSRLLIGVVTPFGASASYEVVTLTPETIILVTILSTIFMGIVSYRSARRTASLPIIETLRYYAPGETRVHYTPGWDIAMLAYAVLVYVVYWYMLSSPSNFFIFMIGAILVASLPLAPILLIIGSVRLMTRSTGKVYEKMSRVLRPFAKNLEHVISRNLSRNPRRSSNIAIIIALGLAFGVFITCTFASQQAILTESVRASLGADLAADVPFAADPSLLSGLGSNLSAIPGVAGVTHVQPVSAQISLIGSSVYPSVVALDPSSYFSVTNPASFFFENPSSAAAAQTVLATPGEVLITGNLARDGALQVGDPLLLTVNTYANGTQGSVSQQVTIGGIVRFLPGTSSGGFYGAVPAPDAVYGSTVTLGKLIDASASSGIYYSSGNRYLISLQPGADWKTVKAEVLSLGFPVVTSYQEQLNQLSANPSTGSLLGFMEMEIAFIVVILTAGLGLIVYAASLERTVEFAGITARGSSSWQTAALLVGEAFVIMAIGVLTGVGVGLLTGYLSTSVTTPVYGGGELIIPTLFVFPADAWLLVLVAPAAMLGTAVLVSWRIARMNVARVLKMRGG